MRSAFNRIAQRFILQRGVSELQREEAQPNRLYSSPSVALSAQAEPGERFAHQEGLGMDASCLVASSVARYRSNRQLALGLALSLPLELLSEPPFPLLSI